MKSQRTDIKGIELITSDDGFTLAYHSRLILRHSSQSPCLWVGAGEADIEMFRGNFSIKDKLNEKVALNQATVVAQPQGWAIRFTRGDAVSATLHIGIDSHQRLLLELKTTRPAITVSGSGWPRSRGPYLRLRRTVLLFRSAR